jgi:sigma-B regulation protein RsbU (phosphoserine phosphatase)
MLASDVIEPKPFCERVNKAVTANNVPGKFITFFYCVVDSGEKRISYTNAGHNWPILAHADGSLERLTSDDVVLGTMREWSYHQQQTELRSGDRLVLFTDGITESANAEGEEFSEERLVELVSHNVHLPASELKDLILARANEHCSSAFTDDATLIVVAVH